MALIAGVALLALLALFNAMRSLRGRVAKAESHAREMQRNLVTAEALVKAEPQILIY